MSKEPTLFDLQERLAFLERHVQQQDLEIYAQSEQIRRLQAALTQLRAQAQAGRHTAGDPVADAPAPADERPPHY